MATGQYNEFPIDWKTIDASQVPYTNTASGLSATDVQNAIDELADGTLTAGDGIDITNKVISTDNDSALTSAVKPAQAKAVGDALATKADSDGNYEDMTVGTADQLMSKKGLTDTAPYLFRAIPHNSTREVMRKLVGATVGWNQLCNGSSVTVQNGHKYYMVKSGTESFGVSDGTALTGLTSGTDMVTDVTLALGTTIADYVYGLETATAGAGVAWLKEHFPKAFSTYQPYDAGSLKSVEGLVSHDTVGFNQFNKDASYTTKAPYRFVDVPIGKTNELYMSFTDKDTSISVSDLSIGFREGDGIEQILSYNWVMMNGRIRTNRSNVVDNKLLDKVFAYPNTTDAWERLNARYDICVNISDLQRNGQYEPYQKHSYPLDPTQELRGIFKLDSSNNIYADGDEWYADGRKNVRYGIVDLGTLTWSRATPSGQNARFYASAISSLVKRPTSSSIGNITCSSYVPVSDLTASYTLTVDKVVAIGGDGYIYIVDNSYTDAATFKTAMNGVYLVYELATPTESTAPSFADTQIIDPDGTEEFVTESIVPVGTETFYADDLVGKIDDIPDLPTTAGDYRLRVTVTAGVPSYEWIAT